MPMSAGIEEQALGLYPRQGSIRKLSYFDSLHLATALRYDIPFLTSDKYIIVNAGIFKIEAIDLAEWRDPDFQPS
jgi:predicted nucleic acid-binding protein